MAKILVVDDSAMQIKLLCRLLTDNGYETVATDSGRDAIELAQIEQPDLVLLDVVMPDMNGYDVTRHLTRNNATRHIPIVLVSSKSQEADKQWGLRQGAKEYLVKPYSGKDAIDLVNRLLAENSVSQAAG